MSVNFNRNAPQYHLAPEAPLQAGADQQKDTIFPLFYEVALKNRPYTEYDKEGKPLRSIFLAKHPDLYNKDVAIISPVSERQADQGDGAALSSSSVARLRPKVKRRCDACENTKTTRIWRKVRHSNYLFYRCKHCSNKKNYGNIQRSSG